MMSIIETQKNRQSRQRLFWSVPPLCLAVNQASYSDGDSFELEEIIVTAERRAENIQDVPVAVTALSEDMLERRQIGNVQDLQASVPNISLAQNTGTADGARIFLRGIGEDESRVTADPAVAMYVDGVYVGRQVGAMFDLVDIERVEVLRGPQGTLYGRNANGGAIKLVSKKPSTEQSTLNSKLTLANENRVDARISGNLAVSDRVALQAALLDKRRDGFYRTSNGVEVGEVDSTALRLAAAFTTNNDIEFLLTYDRMDSDSDPLPAASLPQAESASGLDGDVYTLENALYSPAGAFGDPNPDTVYHNETTQDGFSLSISLDVGEYSISSLTARRTMENELGSVIVNQYTQDVDQDQISQEVQIASNYEGNINWVGGLFYYSEEVDQDYFFFSTNYEMTVETEALALFGQVNVDLSDALRLSVGGRYTTEDKEFDGRCFGSFTPSGCLLTPVNTVDDDETFTNTDYKVSISYDLNADAMVFASYTTGFKSGGWSPDNFGAVDEETVDTVEFGIKSDWMDRRLRLNATYFFNDYQDLQIAGTTSLGFTRFNVDEVETSGVELELVALPAENIEVTANVGYLDGDYVKIPQDVLDAATIPSESASLKNAPQWSATLGATYTIALQDSGELSLGLDIAYEEESYNLVANPEAVKRDDTTLINARASWTSNDDAWQVALWAKNLEDEVYYPAASGPYVYVGEPRTYGVDVSYRM
jgi:iron complex outermembrane receptor protein